MPRPYVRRKAPNSRKAMDPASIPAFAPDLDYAPMERFAEAAFHPRRLVILEACAVNRRTVTELSYALGWQDSLVSLHLRRLVEAKLVRVRREGIRRPYTITPLGRRLVAHARAIMADLAGGPEGPSPIPEPEAATS